MQNLLERIKDLDIIIQLDGNDLRLSIPEHVDCADIIDEIRENKQDLIDYIQVKQVSRVNNQIGGSSQAQETRLTPSQRRLFILDQLAKDSVVYNIPQAIEILGDYNIELLKQSVNQVIQRHQILRTKFSLDDHNTPIQTVNHTFEFNLELFEASEETEIDTAIQRFVRPFDLAEPPLVRVGLIKAGEKRSILMVDVHHIVMDGIGLQIFIKELLDIYNQKALSPNPIQFNDYVKWYYSPATQKHILKQRAFWLQQLSGYNNDVKLPTDFPRKSQLSFEGKSITFDLEAEHLEKLNALAKQSDSSLYMVLLSIYGVLVSKLTNTTDIVIGTPIANRTHTAFQSTIGMFVNTLAIRLQPRASLFFRDYLKQVTKTTLACFDNQEYVYEELIKDLNLSRSAEANPLFDALISLNNIKETKFQANGIEIRPLEIEKPTAKFDISLHFKETAEALGCTFEYRSDLFTEETVNLYFNYFKNIVDQVLTQEDLLVKNISLVSKDQAKDLLNVNDLCKVSYPDETTIVEVFEKQVATYPQNTALVVGEECYTYQQLNDRANQIAWKLREEGVQRDQIVGLFMDKSFEMIAGMLGILKAGGAYLPIDLTYPASRINYILEQSGTALVLTKKDTAHRIEAFKGSVLLMEEIQNNQTENPVTVNESSDLCYIIYTSGTTGNPKGVMVEHHNLIRLLFNDAFQFEFSQDDVWTMFHGTSFDFSVWEMYGALLYGGKLVIIPPETARNSFAFRNIVQNQKVTVLNQTPTAFYNFIKASDDNVNARLPHLRYVVFGGEELVPGKLLNWHKNNPNTALINMYGITETTVHVTFKALTEEDMKENRSNIGKPLPTSSIYLLDEHMKLVPQGNIGEIFVGGAGVSRGYLNNSELTATKFVPDPFKENQILYRSGDVARLLSNGELEYLGRNDRQVQVKGFRIELGEIEYQLEQNEFVKQAVVITKEDGKYASICAYVVAEEAVDLESLREYLNNYLPYYMVPNYFIQIDSIPYTSNFKVDYKSLPAPTQVELSSYVAPATKEQKIMSEIWLKHLSAIKVGIHDNFFALGGDSIRALSVISETNDAINATLEIADIYANPTIGELSNFLTHQSNSNREITIAAAKKQLKDFQEHYKANFSFDENYEEVYPMNGIEKGMVFHSLEGPEVNENIHDIIYHEQNIYLFYYKEWSLERFKIALNLLVEKHDALRKVFDLENLAHIILKEVEPELTCIDITDLGQKEQEDFIDKRMHEEKLRATKLDFSLFWRMTLFKISETHRYLLFDFHHSLFDGWSLSSFLTELHNTYTLLGEDPAYLPRPLQSTFQDQIIGEIASCINEESIQYWKSELRGFERLRYQSTGLDHEFRTHYYDLGKGLRKQLTQVAQEYNSNIIHLCFIAYLQMMKLFTGMNDVLVGLVSNNRPTTRDGERLLGCFLNTIPFRAQLEGDRTWRELVQYVEAKLVELKRHEKMPLGEIVSLVEEQTNTISPIFENSFHFIDFHIFNEFMGSHTEVEEETGFQFSNYMNNNTLFDCVITAHNSTFKFVILHSTTIIDDVISAKLFDYFKQVLYKLLECPDEYINQNELLSSGEKEFLLKPALNPVQTNQTYVPIIEQFETQANRTPNALAIQNGNQKITYSELKEKAKRLGYYLDTQKEIRPGDFVGIKLPRSEWSVIALLGVLNTRACYLPIDPNTPEGMLQAGYCKEIIDADWIAEYLQVNAPCDLSNWQMDYQATDKVYLIYGEEANEDPKNISTTNEHLASYLRWAMTNYESGLDHFSFPYFMPLSVPNTQAGIFLSLLSGGTLSIYQGDQKESLNRILTNPNINSIKLTPAQLQDLPIGTPTTIVNFILAGEPLLPSHIKKLRTLSNKARIFNAYGSVETTFECITTEVMQPEAGKCIPIGKPIGSNRAYVLNNQRQLAPIGVVGDLYVAGASISKGYFNNNSLTQQKFLSNPFAIGEELKMFRTGDQARWNANGELELIGSKADQPKIGGNRIDLVEVMGCIDQFDMVSQNVVQVRSNEEGAPILVAYVVPNSIVYDETLLRKSLKEKLPVHMIPEVFLELERLPLQEDGKVDKKALSTIDLDLAAVETDPRNEIEVDLLEIWQDVLKLEDISIQDNFFELGGNSLLAIVLQNKIQRAFDVKVPMQSFFAEPTIASLSNYLQASTVNDLAIIEPAPDQAFYPLSSAQKRQYFIYQLYPDTLLYNIPVILRVRGAFDLHRYQSAVQQLFERHAILRTCFKVQDENPVQWILEDVRPEFESIPCTESAIQDHILRFVRPFDLANELPLRFEILEVAEDDHVLLTDMHHIIFDALSRDILLKELMSLYLGENLPKPKLQYKDYAVWQAGAYYQETVMKHQDYWLDVYKEPAPLLELPTDFKRPEQLKDRAHISRMRIGKALCDKIRPIVNAEGTTMFNFMMAAFNVFLSKLTNQEDIAVGIVTSGRQHADLEGVIGMFANTLALRNTPISYLTFREFLATVHEQTVKSFDHQFYPYEDLIDSIKIPRLINRNPIFDVFMVYSQKVDEALLDYSDFTMEAQKMPFEVAKFDLTLTVIEAPDEIELSILGHQDLFEASTVDRFLNYLEHIVEQIAVNPDQRLSHIEIIKREEKVQLLGYNQFGNAPQETVIDQFLEQVQETPKATAIHCGEVILNYEELNAKANQLAQYLIQEFNIQPADFVGIKLEHNEWPIIALLAILKARASYVPIDPQYPDQRIEFIERDSQCKAMIDRHWIADYLKVEDQFDGNFEPLDYQMTDHLYMIYTSGSTGNPKGVAIHNGNLSNYLDWANSYYKGSLENYSFPFFTSLSFDLTQTSILLTLLSGGKLFIYDSSDLGQTMETILSNPELNSIKLTPSHLQLINEQVSSTSIVNFILGGEALLPSHIRKIQSFSDQASIFNEYGPTETTIGCTCVEVQETSDGNTVSIGTPIANTSIYILNKQNQLVPPGVIGELCVGGAGVATGYWNRPELNRKKFVDDPFTSGRYPSMYKTGDLAKWNANGELELIGRKDDQVKVRGYRIEPNEISSYLDKHSAVNHNVVLAKQDAQGQNRLVAYIVPKQVGLDKHQLKNDLRKVMPGYMIPDVIMELEELPLNQNGKVDRKALLQESLVSTVTYVAPGNDMEAKVLELWKEVLKIEESGIHNNFFDLGGNSLYAIVLTNKIQAAFDVKVPMQALFTNPTVASLVEYMEHTAVEDQVSIEQAPEQAYYPLSSAQKRQYFIYQLHPDTLLYNIPVVLRIDGKFDVWKYEQVIRNLFERHAILRTYFKMDGENPVQWMEDKVEIKLEPIPCSETEINNHIETFVRPFRLDEELPIRFAILKISDEHHVLMTDMHHIIFDEQSRGILLREMMELYRGVSLSEPKLQYKDYAVWQEGEYYQNTLLKHKDYWVDVYKEPASLLELPTDYPRPVELKDKAHVCSFSLDKASVDKIRPFLREEGTTMFNFMMAAFNILLSKLSKQEDIAVGIVTSGRQHADLENVIGMFANTLALRNYPKRDQTFKAFLAAVHENTLQSFDHQFYPYEDLIDSVKIPRLLNRNPIFDVFMVYGQKVDDALLDYADFKMSLHDMPFDIAKFDLTFSISDSPEEIELSFAGHQDLFEFTTVERFTQYFGYIIEQIITDPTKRLEAIDIVPPLEIEKLMSFNQIGTVPEKTIMEAFSEKVKQHPNQPALGFYNYVLSYRELDRRSNQLARYLRAKGIGKETMVGICLDRSMEMVISFLGILKAGATYVPIDPQYPDERIDFLLNDAGINWILSDSKYANQLQEKDCEVISLDKEWERISEQSHRALRYKIRPDNLAYVIYTSGSTGRPKGVMVEHRNLVNMFQEVIQRFHLTEKDKVLQMAAYTFDASIYETLMGLLSGATLVVADQEIIRDTELLINYMEAQEVSFAFFTPAYLKVLNKDKLKFLRCIVSGGEAANVEDAQYLSQFVEYHNAYGPTECAICVSTYEMPAQSSGLSQIPIGKPLGNVKAYVLDSEDKPCPIGVVGELCVSGTGMARGYLNQPELTNNRFVANTFSPIEKMYRTGDYVRWNNHGELEYMGRRDNQVKVRGFRIELGEIEAILEESSLISQASVQLITRGNNHKLIVAYIVPDASYDADEVRHYLDHTLPGHMRPSSIVEVDQIPLTAHGKVDKKALIALGGLQINQDEAPEGHLEVQLAAIWKNILGIETIGAEENFFEIGGNSLLAIRIVETVKAELNHNLKVKDVFLYPSIRAIGRLIESNVLDDRYEPILKLETSDSLEAIPLSYYQEYIWIVDRLNGSSHYNIPMVQLFGPQLDPDALEYALRQLVKRHQPLRTIIKEEGEQAYQEILIPENWQMSLVELDETVDLAGLQQYVSEEVSQSFNLYEDYRIRACLFKIGSRGYALAMTIHHIAADAQSMTILVKELFELSAAYRENRTPNLKPITIEYSDYARWQRKQLGPQVLNEKLNYWENKLNGVEPIQLPLDYPRPKIKSLRGDTMHIQFDANLTNGIVEFCKNESITPFIFLLSAFKVLLHRYSGQEDICIGTPISDRRDEVEDLIGFFINTAAIRSNLQGNLTFNEVLEQLKETVFEVYDHRDTPIHEVIQRVVKSNDPSITPLFQAMFHMQNAVSVNQKAADLRAEVEAVTGTLPFNLEEMSSGYKYTKFDLEFNVSLQTDQLDLEVEYCVDLFKPSTIERLVQHYQCLILELLEDKSKQIRDYDFLPKEEKALLLDQYNANTDTFEAQTPIAQLFEAQVKRTPNQTALIFGDCELTYAELYQKSSQLANYLIQHKQITPGDFVGIKLDRSEWPIIALLAILQARACYVPIDPDYPTQRVQYIETDSQCKEIIDGDWIDAYLQVKTELDSNLDRMDYDMADNLYMIYTSGSTGRPKGVAIDNNNLANYVEWAMDYYRGELAHYSFPFFTSLSFDLTQTSILLTLLSGGKLFVYEGADLTETMQTILTNAEINSLKLTPSHLQLIEEGYSSPITNYILGGEALLVSHIEKLKSLSPQVRIFNEYGPTEATIGCTCVEVQNYLPGEAISIGQPIANTKIYILDRQNNLVPKGVVGELCVAGEGVAKGYFKRPELSSERFMADPFDHAGERSMYRTGDLARWNESGMLELVGRKDDQVKVRGYRVELGEITAWIDQSELVDQNIVLAKKDRLGNTLLVAYIVPTQNGFDQQQLQEYLLDVMPHYLVPSVFVEIDALPLTQNGKIDKEDLLQRRISKFNVGIAPRNEIEANLLAIWQEMLQMNDISVQDNFFEMGGNSLLALKLIFKLEEVYATKLNIATLIKHPTIETLAKYLDTDTKGQQSLLLALNESPNQPAIYCIPAISGDPAMFLELAKSLEGSLSVNAFQFQGHDGVAQPHASIEEMATAYMEEMLLVNPDGPFNLVGYSYGSKIAYEMMVQLQERGYEVGQFIVIDAFAPHRNQQTKAVNYHDLIIQWFQTFLQEFGVAKHNVDVHDLLDKNLEECIELLHREANRLGVAINYRSFRGKVAYGLRACTMVYEPNPSLQFDTPTTLFYTNAGLGYHAWDKVIPQERIALIPVRSQHETILNAPHIQTVIDQMKTLFLV